MGHSWPQWTALAVFMLVSVASDEVQCRDCIRVVTYNIWDQQDSDQQGYSWAERKELLAAEIRAANPHLVGFQEVRRALNRSSDTSAPDQFRDLSELFPDMYGAFFQGMEYPEQGVEEGLAIFSDGPILDSTRHQLPHAAEDPLDANQRIAVRVMVYVNRVHLNFLVTHFSYAEEDQMSNAMAAAEFASRFSVPQILVADFNTEAGYEAPMDLLCGRTAYAATGSSAEAVPAVQLLGRWGPFHDAWEVARLVGTAGATATAAVGGAGGAQQAANEDGASLLSQDVHEAEAAGGEGVGAGATGGGGGELGDVDSDGGRGSADGAPADGPASSKAASIVATAKLLALLGRHGGDGDGSGSDGGDGGLESAFDVLEKLALGRSSLLQVGDSREGLPQAAAGVDADADAGADADADAGADAGVDEDVADQIVELLMTSGGGRQELESAGSASLSKLTSTRGKRLLSMARARAQSLRDWWEENRQRLTVREGERVDMSGSVKAQIVSGKGPLWEGGAGSGDGEDGSAGSGDGEEVGAGSGDGEEGGAGSGEGGEGRAGSRDASEPSLVTAPVNQPPQPSSPHPPPTAMDVDEDDLRDAVKELLRIDVARAIETRREDMTWCTLDTAERSLHKRVDRVLFRDHPGLRLLPAQVLTLGQARRQDGTVVSDHAGVLVVFRIAR